MPRRRRGRTQEAGDADGKASERRHPRGPLAAKREEPGEPECQQEREGEPPNRRHRHSSREQEPRRELIRHRRRAEGGRGLGEKHAGGSDRVLEQTLKAAHPVEAHRVGVGPLALHRLPRERACAARLLPGRGRESAHGAAGLGVPRAIEADAAGPIERGGAVGRDGIPKDEDPDQQNDRCEQEERRAVAACRTTSPQPRDEQHEQREEGEREQQRAEPERDPLRRAEPQALAIVEPIGQSESRHQDELPERNRDQSRREDAAQRIEREESTGGDSRARSEPSRDPREEYCRGEPVDQCLRPWNGRGEILDLARQRAQPQAVERRPRRQIIAEPSARFDLLRVGEVGAVAQGRPHEERALSHAVRDPQAQREGQREEDRAGKPHHLGARGARLLRRHVRSTHPPRPPRPIGRVPPPWPSVHR